MPAQNQMELEKLFNKNQLMKRIRQEFHIPDFASHMVRHGIPLDFGIDLLVRWSSTRGLPWTCL